MTAKRAVEAAAYEILPCGPLEEDGQVWHWSAWAVGPRSQAVKIFLVKDHEANPNEIQEMKAQASGLYRRTYQQWCNGFDFAQEYKGGAAIQEALV